VNALLAPESCPFCGAGIMLRGSGTTFLCESWKHRNGEMDQSRECLNRQRDQLLDRIKRLEEALHRIANTDYRGNRSTESQIAFEALKEDKL
jgi:hypothetical protein